METITVEQLLGNVGNLAFTYEDLILQLSSSDDSNEDFKIVHREDLFVVPLQGIREFFQDHPKPKRKMGKDEELEFLRKKVATLESNERPKTFAEPSREPATASFGEKWTGPKISALDDEPLIPEKESLPHERDKRETVEEIQGRLGAELRGKKPDNMRGRPSKNIKAKLEIPSKG
jgi:hypothetical protein